MARYRILGWQGVPAQLEVTDERGTVKAQLPEWFMQEIDRRAMEQGLVGSDEYLGLWEWTAERERAGDAQAVADALVAELVADWHPGADGASD